MIAIAPSRPDLAWRTDRRLFDPHSLPAYLMLTAAVAVIAGAVGVGAFTCDPALFASTGQALGFGLAFGWAARWIGFDTIATPLEIAFLLLSSTVLLCFCSVIAASTDAPLLDARLLAVDRLAFGFDRRAAVAAALGVPMVRTVAMWAYGSLAFSPFLVTTLLVLVGRRDRAWIVATALIAAAAVSVASLAVTPAYGSPPYAYRFAAVLRDVRGGASRTLNADVMTGLVTFPSIHAADALILGWGSIWLGRLGAPLVLLNMVMLVSALLVGGHYLTDIVAGCAVAAIAMATAGRVHAGIGRPTPSTARAIPI